MVLYLPKVCTYRESYFYSDLLWVCTLTCWIGFPSLKVSRAFFAKYGAFSVSLVSHRVVGTPDAEQLQPRHSLYNWGPGVALQNTCSIALLSSDSYNSLSAGGKCCNFKNNISLPLWNVRMKSFQCSRIVMLPGREKELPG